MVSLIQELLLTNNCVIIPGFGAFIGNYQPAEIHLSENKILPPSKIIAFNRILQANDGLLINYTANKFAISYKEAEEKVNAYAKSCNDTLSQHKSLIFKNIGRVIIDEQQNIQFQPFYIQNYLLNSYGLKSMSLEPIYRLKDTEKAIKENYHRVMHPELMEDAVTPKTKSKSRFFKFASALAVCIGVFAIGWSFYTHNPNINYASFIPMFDNKPIKHYEMPKVVSTTKPVSKFIQNKIDVTTREITQGNTIIEDTAIAEITSNTRNKSYIIVGTFFDKTRAEKLKSESEKMGFITSISIDNKNGLYRVNVAVENKEVKPSLEKIKSTLNPRAWVYCMKCNLK